MKMSATLIGVETYSHEEVVDMLEKLEALGLPDEVTNDMTLLQINQLVNGKVAHA